VSDFERLAREVAVARENAGFAAAQNAARRLQSIAESMPESEPEKNDVLGCLHEPQASTSAE
jgi:hypothetical protein